MRFIGLLVVAGVIGFSNGTEAQEWEVHEGHAVKGNDTNEELIFNDTDAQDLDEFVDLCREVCTSGEGDGPRGACGGFVVNYTDRSKTAPRVCVFKLAGSQPYARQGKDTHILVDAEAGSESEEVGGEETSHVEIQALIDNAVAEALEGMVPKIEMEEAIDAAVGEATAQLEADLQAMSEKSESYHQQTLGMVSEADVEARIAEARSPLEYDLPGCDSYVNCRDIEGMIRGAQLVTSATEGMYSHAGLQARIAEATEGMVSEAEVQAAVAEATQGMVLESDVEACEAGAAAQQERWLQTLEHQQASMVSEYDHQVALREAREGMFSAAQVQMRIAQAMEGMVHESQLQAHVQYAVAEATQGMPAEAEFQVVLMTATEGMFTEADLESHVAEETRRLSKQHSPIWTARWNRRGVADVALDEFQAAVAANVRQCYMISVLNDE